MGLEGDVDGVRLGRVGRAVCWPEEEELMLIALDQIFPLADGGDSTVVGCLGLVQLGGRNEAVGVLLEQQLGPDVIIGHLEHFGLVYDQRDLGD